jgi:hypothetical protein
VSMHKSIGTYQTGKSGVERERLKEVHHESVQEFDVEHQILLPLILVSGLLGLGFRFAWPHRCCLNVFAASACSCFVMDEGREKLRTFGVE